MKINKSPFLFILAGLVILSLFLTIWMPVEEAFRAVFGGAYLLFAPGLAIMYACFGDGEMTLLERIPIAFGLSLVTVSLLNFSLLRLGMPINPWTILAVTTGIVIVAVLIRSVLPKRTSKISNPSS